MTLVYEGGSGIIAAVVRVLILVVSLLIVYFGVRRYKQLRGTEYLFAACLGAMWGIFYMFWAASSYRYAGIAFAPDVVRPMILLTLTLILAWLFRWCR